MPSYTCYSQPTLLLTATNNCIFLEIQIFLRKHPNKIVKVSHSHSSFLKKIKQKKLFSCCQPHASCLSVERGFTQFRGLHPSKQSLFDKLPKMRCGEAFTIVNVNHPKVSKVQRAFIIILQLLWAYFIVQEIPSVCCCLSFLSRSSSTAFALKLTPLLFTFAVLWWH